MPIDLTIETPITLKEAGRHRLMRRCDPKGRERPRDFSTMWRYALHGIRGVKLETVRVGAAMCTTEGALIRFVERLSGRPDKPRPARNQAMAERALAEAGI